MARWNDAALLKAAWDTDTGDRTLMRVHVLEGATSSSVGTPKYVSEVKYDQFGNVVEIDEQINNQGITLNTYYSYDDENRVVDVICDEGDRIIAYTYDAIGNPLTYDGWTFTWKTGRMLASMVKNGTNAQFTYDHNGLRIKKVVHMTQSDVVALIDANGTQVVEYGYDAWGNLISKSGSMAATIAYLYTARRNGWQEQ